ncbi:Na+/H+ antiporter NhaA [Belnapia moabensis]|uniref:Na+/H+ antiporter NhaA n=1 Tax=Belnapia moabensis TaxID=365533 RepID=UPI0005B77084|nr:Na+/H+ antiporter NhaA [Belnapia moabensis]
MPDMPVRPASRRARSLLRDFLHNSASGGLVLMAAAVLALILANSAAAPVYFGALESYVGPLSLLHWINDALMAVFFLLVGLEIKREMLDGQLAGWGRRILPGIAAAGGMAVPALIYVAFNAGNATTLRGWAIPAATDIAFALGVLALLGSRVPASLRIFLTALAILDDLGAVAIIAVFYTGEIALPYLGLAGLVSLVLVGLNRAGVCRLLPYLLLGAVLWWLTLRSGVHATVAGVVLALTIPLRNRPGGADDLAASPLHRLEHALHLPVAFLIVPVFGFANAGVSFAGLTMEALLDPLTLGVALGLLVGKLIGVFGAAGAAIRLGWADMPVDANWWHLLGTALLCGIGFTMSLFIGMLAFEGEPLLQAEVKIGILTGSVLAGLLGAAVLRAAPRRAD